MRKSIAIVSLLMVIGSVIPSVVAARTIPVSNGTVDCESQIFTDSTTFATSTASQNQLVGCSSGNGNPMLVMEPWGKTVGDSMVLRIPSGTTFRDAAGIDFLCPEITGVFGCFDLVTLDYWKNQARTIAKQTNGVGRFAYWLTH